MAAPSTDPRERDYIDHEAAVVVGLGLHAPLSDGTVEFAVLMARGLGLGIEVVHVVPTLPGNWANTYDAAGLRDRLLAEGQERLDREVARMRERLAGAQPVEGVVVEDAVVPALVQRSRRADLVILERREHRAWDGLGGSVTTSVSARAHAPVISVPAGWHPPADERPVVVAVEDADRAPAEIWTAASVAVATHRSMEVLRASHLPSAYRDILRREGQEEESLRRVRDELEHDVTLPLSVTERVPCTFVARWGNPAEVLVDASPEAFLMVLARRDPLLPVGSHLGPVVRRVLRGATCPVLVVDPARGRSRSGVPHEHRRRGPAR